MGEQAASVCDTATRVGRKADAIDIWVVSYASVRPTRDEAIEDPGAFIAVNGMAIRTPELLAQANALARTLNWLPECGSPR